MNLSIAGFINDADEIIHRLWVGNFNSSQDRNFLIGHHVTVIVNCTKDLPFLDLRGVFKYRVPVDDNLETTEMESMALWLKHILPIIEAHYQKGRTILVHCMAGQQRSAIVMLCYLCQYHYKNPKMALSNMRHRRPIVFTPKMNFSLSFYLYFGPEVYYRLFR